MGKKRSIFNLIAPIYGLFYHVQKKHYHSVLDNVNKKLDFTNYQTVIDVGCGTGALSSVLNERGFTVTGIDPAEKMLKIARNKQENKAIEFIKASGTKRLAFDAKSFDLSIASYVAHGLKADERKKMYDEMNRITKHLIIIHDYNDKRAMSINLIEWLERGDYFNFIKDVKNELKEIFREVRILNIASYGAWYICVPF